MRITTGTRSCKSLLIHQPSPQLISRAAIAEAWLGPAYKILTDLNSVTRGNVQEIHRDYRTCFLHDMSITLTLPYI